MRTPTMTQTNAIADSDRIAIGSTAAARNKRVR